MNIRKGMKMGRSRRLNVVRTILQISFAMLLLSNVSMAVSPEQLRQVSADEWQKIQQAMPAKPTATPAQPRRVLVFWLCNEYFHKCIPVANKAFEIMGAKTGTFETVVSNDMAMFDAENLKNFDAVLLNNTTKLNFEDAKRRQALVDFVKGGKGIIGIHAATDNFYDWPEGAEMMGALFDRHPWGASGTWAIKVDEADHVVNAAFDGKGFLVRDEIYQMKAPYSREKLRVLLSMDMSQKRNLDVIRAITFAQTRRKDDDYAVAWVRRYGQGRVFYSGLGHNDEIFWNPKILQHYLDGIQYALGDLPADDTSSQLDRETLDNILLQMRNYDYGQSRQTLTQLDDFIIRNNQGDRLKVIEQRLAAFLQSEATPAGKQFVCRKLSLIGTEASVPTLAAMLAGQDTSDMARYALERIPGASVDEALRDALSKTTGQTRVGIINSLGVRGDRASVGLLSSLVYQSDEQTAAAAIAALGSIADSAAADTLTEAVKKTSGNIQLLAYDAYLQCADRLASEGKQDKAFVIYEKVYKSVRADNIRAAALTGMVATAGKKAVNIITGVLGGRETGMQSVAISLIRQVPSKDIVKAATDRLAKLGPEQQVQLISALADRGDASALDAVAKSIKSKDEAVRLAVLGAVGVLGDASTVGLLAESAADSSGPEQEAARDSLYRLRGPKVDEEIVAMIGTARPQVRVELIRSVQHRNITAAAQTLLKTAADSDRNVRLESIKVLKFVAGPQQLPELVDILVQAAKSGEQLEAGRTVVAVAGRIEDSQRRADAVLTALATVDDVQARCALLEVAGKIGGYDALKALRANLGYQNNQVQIAAVRGLAECPGPEAMPDLGSIAENSEDPVKRVLALRGFIRQIGLESDRPASETIMLYEKAMKLAANANEKKMVLSGVANVPSFGALKMAGEYLDVSELRQEAAAAVVKIAEDTKVYTPQQAETTKYLLSKVVTVSQDQRLRKRAEGLINKN